MCALSFALLGGGGMYKSAGAVATAGPGRACGGSAGSGSGSSGLEFGGPRVSIYHPDTKTLYIWSGDPSGNLHLPMKCTKIQMGDKSQRRTHDQRAVFMR